MPGIFSKKKKMQVQSFHIHYRTTKVTEVVPADFVTSLNHRPAFLLLSEVYSDTLLTIMTFFLRGH